eukprot:m.491424 g.491424  ORF g.491424 m.491424 type:complete len:460 (-) comp57261_c0_seq1:186-1565(-)
MSEYDLTNTVCKYLDRHMVFPLLQFWQDRKIHAEAQVLEAKLHLLTQTNMVDYAMDIYEKLHPESTTKPENLVEKRTRVVSRLKVLQEESKPMVEFLQSDEVLKYISAARESPNLSEQLEENFGFQPSMLDVFYDFARFQFDCGNYADVPVYLYHYQILSTKPEKVLSALWGKFAADILTQNWEEAYEEMNKLKNHIDTKFMGSAVEVLQQRTWFIHWSLFVFFNHAKGGDSMIDILLYDPHYCNVIQAACPHILRYLTSAVITNKRRRSILKDLVKAIQCESYEYRDPITEFLECLYVNFDFDGAQLKLRECERVLENDFFLVEIRDDFIENARLFIFETYCRIHNTISIKMLAEKLNMNAEEAEEWIVNLIRNARLDAKIDSKEGNVVMTTQVTSIYHHVIEKTKTLSFRTSVLADNIERPQPVGTDAAGQPHHQRSDRPGGKQSSRPKQYDRKPRS